MEIPKLLTLPEVEALLHCKRRRIFDLLKDGTLIRGPRFGRHTVIRAESVYAALEANYDPPVPAKRKQYTKTSMNEAFDAVLAATRATRCVRK